MNIYLHFEGYRCDLPDRNQTEKHPQQGALYLPYSDVISSLLTKMNKGQTVLRITIRPAYYGVSRHPLYLAVVVLRQTLLR